MRVDGKLTSMLLSFLFLFSGACKKESKKVKIETSLDRVNLGTEISKYLHDIDVLTSLDTIPAQSQDNRVEEPVDDTFDELTFLEKDEKDSLSQKQGEIYSSKVKSLSEKRRSALFSRKTVSLNLKEEHIHEAKAYSFIDINYVSRLKDIGEDVSTFPLKGDRVITADRYIPVILENSIHSQLPGRFIALVERHIFANEGRNVLLPKGTRIICSYKSLVREGDTRLNAVCARAIRPDGASILLTNAYAADQMARTGLIGEVDNRTWEKYGSAFLVAGISALAGAGASISDTPVVRQASSNLSINLGNITTGVLNEHISLAPIITVAAGSRLQIIPTTDIWLRMPEEIQEEIPSQDFEI